jgi:hypothetical protein
MRGGGGGSAKGRAPHLNLASVRDVWSHAEIDEGTTFVDCGFGSLWHFIPNQVHLAKRSGRVAAGKGEGGKRYKP